ncbi:MAG TPA: hypothetical protein VFR78_16060 [Pyrinomonadaceae bacterium]|nr:hypothetical protein [Pyrinomonadaceae bacterium]
MKLALIIVVLCVVAGSTHATERTRITIVVAEAGQVSVEAESSPRRSWSFRNAYAGALGIAERVENFHVFSNSGADPRLKKSATGEFRSELDATRISYNVRLSQPTPRDVAHTSWIADERGFLMFADLLPIDFETPSVEFRLPEGWTVQTAIERGANGRYEVTAPEKAVFFIGRSLRNTSKSIDGMILDTMISGNWPFKDADAVKASIRVFKKYIALTGFKLPQKSAIMIAPLPVQVGSTKWRAETRGSTVVLLMDPAASIQNWPGQLGVIFTHELLHLWVPNSLKLQGDYDWFFEGFTLYIALRTALELKIISFKEFLATIARVYDSYISSGAKLSLIEASETRWTSSGSVVYDKGMLVALLYDLMIRAQSDGKITLASRYRDLFNGGVADGQQGNEAIIAWLGSSPAPKDFAKSYIETGREFELDLERVLSAYGLHLNANGQSSQLRVASQLNPDQKRLLRSLGYRD